MSTNLTIAMRSPETRINLNPPLSNVKNIQLLSYYGPTAWVRFSEDQQVYKKIEDGKVSFIIIQKGDYTLKTLQHAFSIDKEETKIDINISSQGSYLKSDKTVNIWLTEQLAKKLGVPEKIEPKKMYPIRWIPDKPLLLFCDIIDKNKSYMNIKTYGTELKLTTSSLLAVIPSKDYPSINISIDHVLNYFTIKLLDNKGRKPDFKNEMIIINLKVSHL